MRHGVKLNRLGRKTAHRKALMSNMAMSLIEHKRITTTLAKAKALREYIEPILTKSKNDTTHNRRLVFSKMQSKETIKELFDNISSVIANRPGGYTRIIKLAPRLGDAAEMAMIELVDYNTIYNGSAEATSDKKKTRRSRGAAKKVETVAKAAPVAEANTEADAEAVVLEETPAVEETIKVEEASVEVVDETPVVAEPQVAEVITEAPVAEVATETSNASADDLKIVEGIGPKIEELFHAKGILTFSQLANTSAEEMSAILEEAGPAFLGKDPSTWAAQAQMCADGKWDELKAWQDELNGGKA